MQEHEVVIIGSGFAEPGEAGVLDIGPEAQASYNQWLQGQMRRTVWLTGGCKSWYLDDHGVNRTLYPGPSWSFWRSLRRVRTDEYELTPVRAPAPDRIEVAA